MFELTLTFDNGPEPAVTARVLDILAARGIRTTFFVIGEKLAAPGARAVVERAKAEGHWIGNHTWTHSGPLGRRAGAELAEDEIGRTQRGMGSLAHPQKLFRPQGGGGALGPHLMRQRDVDFLIQNKMTCVLWNAIPGDWKDPQGWVERAMTQVKAQPHTLMVLHDIQTGAMDHLAAFLDRAADAGARFSQAFPADCMPIVDGVLVRDLKNLTTPD